MTSRVDKDSLPLNQPRRTPSHPDKSHIVKTKVDGKEKLIRFGEQGASTAGKPKEGESDRMKAKRASFKSRHAKNIAKGPSSPAYWANKVKWADGGFVKTNYDDGGRAQTGAYVGYRSAGRRPESQQDRTASANAPLSALRGYVAGTLGLPGDIEGLGRMLIPGVSNESYIPGSEYFRKVLPLSELEQTPTGRAFGEVGNLTGGTGVLTAAKLAGKTGKAGARMVGEELNRAILDNSGPLAKLVPQAAKPLYAVKPKGGNWQPSAGAWDTVDMSLHPLKRNPDVISGDLINRIAGEDLWSKMVDLNVYQYPAAWLRDNRPDVFNKLISEEKGAVNKWLDTKLQKYIRNDMGTPDDPIRLAHEEGFSHIPGQAEELGAWLPEDVAAMRVKAGYPEEGFAVQKHAEAGFPEATEVNTRKAEMWEALSDAEITATPAREFQERFRMAREMPNFVSNGKQEISIAERNPWIEKLAPETPIYKIDRPMDLNENLGFNHMADEIQNMLDPESGLPAALRMTPQQLDKVTMKQMVEKVDNVNKWRSEEAAKAELGDMMSNLTAKARLEIPDAQLSFVKEPGMKWIDIPATTDASAMKLCTTIGRQAGWCTQGEGLAKRYGSGDNSLTTLIDAEGRPHAQAMVSAPQKYISEKDTASFMAQAEEEAKRLPNGYTDSDVNKIAMRMAYDSSPKDIIELKPVENAFNSERAREYTKRDPDYKNKITDSVLDFLKSGSWGDVKDLHHYDIIDAKNPSAIRKFINDNYGGDFGMVDANTIQKDFMKNYNGERFIKAEQFSDLVSDYIPKADGYAGGGLVKGVLKNIDELVRKHMGKEAAEEVVKAAPKEQKMLQGFYRGYAGDYDATKAGTDAGMVFVSPQRGVGDIFANKRAAQTGTDPHLEMILADPFAGYGYGMNVPLNKQNQKIDFTRARQLDPKDVKERTQLYAEGGSVSYDPTRIDEIINSIDAPRFAEGGSARVPSNLHPEVEEALKAGRITPNQAKWMSNLANTPGNPEIGTAGIRDGVSEKMMNYMKAVRAGEFTRPHWMEPIPKEVKMPKWFSGSVDLDREGLRQLDKIPGLTKQAFRASEYSNTYPVGAGDLNYYRELLQGLEKDPTYQPYFDEIEKVKQRNPKFAEGGSVTAYDPSRVNAILNQFM